MQERRAVCVRRERCSLTRASQAPDYPPGLGRVERFDAWLSVRVLGVVKVLSLEPIFRWFEPSKKTGNPARRFVSKRTSKAGHTRPTYGLQAGVYLFC